MADQQVSLEPEEKLQRYSCTLLGYVFRTTADNISDNASQLVVESASNMKHGAQVAYGNLVSMSSLLLDVIDRGTKGGCMKEDTKLQDIVKDVNAIKDIGVTYDAYLSGQVSLEQYQNAYEQTSKDVRIRGSDLSGKLKEYMMEQ
jgi:hypothetical protein